MTARMYGSEDDVMDTTIWSIGILGILAWR